MILTEFSPLTPDSDSKTLSRIICEKSQLMPGSFAAQLLVHLVDQLGLGAAGGCDRAAPAIRLRHDSGTKHSTL